MSTFSLSIFVAFGCRFKLLINYHIIVYDADDNINNNNDSF